MMVYPDPVPRPWHRSPEPKAYRPRSVHWTIALVLYLGIGAVLHAIFYASRLDPHDPLSIAWLVGWPVLMFLAFWVVFLCAFAVCVIVALIITVLDR
jgi:uncharacterized BrkB/YihY/UPF0761 family membrane protein